LAKQSGKELHREGSRVSTLSTRNLCYRCNGAGWSGAALDRKRDRNMVRKDLGRWADDGGAIPDYHHEEESVLHDQGIRERVRQFLMREGVCHHFHSEDHIDDEVDGFIVACHYKKEEIWTRLGH
jgi:hypothetical protein